MKLLFYLPIITDAWIDSIVAPMIRAVGRNANVHVIVPLQWNGTGLSAERVENLSRDAGGTWHLFDDPCHQAIRQAGSTVPALMRLVSGIAADYTICRSADIETPRLFPGRTSFLMEGNYPPFARGSLVKLTSSSLFAHGMLPDLTHAQHALLKRYTATLRETLEPKRLAGRETRNRFLADAGIPEARTVIGMPLEQDGSDNFYMRHSPSPINTAFVGAVAAGLHDRCMLALTVHPAQRRDQQALERLEALDDDRVRIVRTQHGADVTPGLALHCDAMAIRDSKSIAWAAMFGKPIHRVSRFPTGKWLRAYSTLAELDTALQHGAANCASLDDAMSWLGFHLANDAFDPNDSDFTLADLIDRIERPFNPDRWRPALDRRSADLSNAAASIASMEF